MPIVKADKDAFTVKYDTGRINAYMSYFPGREPTYTFTKTEFYCMKCGFKAVYECEKLWEDNAGHQHLCIACGYSVMSPGESYDYLKKKIVAEVLEHYKE